MSAGTNATVIILAAGMGTRLASLTGGGPKALFPVKGRTLLDYSCDFAESLGAERRIVVGGCGFDHIEHHLVQSDRTDFQLVRTEDYRAGNLLSLLAALPLVRGAAFIMNVDHIYSAPVAPAVAR